MIHRIARLLTALLVVSVALALGSSPAHADPIGTVLIIPGESIDLAAIRLRTSAGCPEKADAYYAKMVGQGFPPEGQIVTEPISAGLSHSTGFDVYFAQTMRDFAALAGGITLSGRYDVTVGCIDSFQQASFGEFIGSLEFVTPTNYTALGAAKPNGPVPAPLNIGTVERGVPVEAVNGPVAGPYASPEDAGTSTTSSSDSDEPNTFLLILVGVPILLIMTYRIGRRHSG